MDHRPVGRARRSLAPRDRVATPTTGVGRCGRRNRMARRLAEGERIEGSTEAGATAIMVRRSEDVVERSRRIGWSGPAARVVRTGHGRTVARVGAPEAAFAGARSFESFRGSSAGGRVGTPTDPHRPAAGRRLPGRARCRDGSGPVRRPGADGRATARSGRWAGSGQRRSGRERALDRRDGPGRGGCHSTADCRSSGDGPSASDLGHEFLELSAQGVDDPALRIERSDLSGETFALGDIDRTDHPLHVGDLCGTQ